MPQSRTPSDSTLITTLLVANRGEIARRVFATCRRLGIRTVAVHSDADAELPFVREADSAIRLPGNTPAETYLRDDLVLAAALRAGADAIHPGYGFLSENADFARKVEAAGLTWVGPSPESMEQMGDKITAKALMARAGVPVLDNLAPATDQGPTPKGSRPATEADLPLLVKASAGGGGRGMRVVGSLDDLAREIDIASQEAASAFGDGTVFVEPYVEKSRHIEVQVVGDPARGTTHVLGERDCSLQRRHQKVIEEAPAPGLTEAQRSALHQAARAASNAIGYRGAGTVEFLVDAADPGRFYFLEMNTRLQVEHPVTEAVFGVDLVECQLSVAEGRSPDLDGLEPSGHAIEARLYAEDPAADYQPQTGTLSALEFDQYVAFDRPGRAGIRVDAGFESGSEVGTHYDAMLAKVIAWAPSRAQAARMLAATLRRARIHGLTTNRDLLVNSLTEPSFVAGEVGTDFYDRVPAVRQPREPGDLEALLFAAVVHQELGRPRRVQQGVPVGWRNVVSQPQRSTFLVGGEEHAVEWFGGREGFRHATRADIRVVRASVDSVVLEVDGLRVSSNWQNSGEPDACERAMDLETSLLPVRVTPVSRFTDPADLLSSGSLLAQMPGSVIEVAVSQGDSVEAGQKILVLEAMKMQHTVSAPSAGTVSVINVRPGVQVAAGEVLAVVEEGEPA